jgi:hypothetical protein
MSRKILSQTLAETISGQDLGDARAFFENELLQHQQHLKELGSNADALDVAKVQLEIARAQIGLGDKTACWQTAQPLLEVFIDHDCFQPAVESCELMYLAEHENSIKALGHGCWLAVTYPVETALSVDMLSYIIDETPDDSDGAAVASVAAMYLVELREQGTDKDNLIFLAKQLVALVAKRHRGIEDEESIEIWIEMLELNNLDELFTRLGKVIDAIVGNEWWFERDDLRAKLPDQ